MELDSLIPEVVAEDLFKANAQILLAACRARLGLYLGNEM